MGLFGLLLLMHILASTAISESQDQGNEIPAEFGLLIKRIAPIEMAAQLLMIAILLLMVVKPL